MIVDKFYSPKTAHTGKEIKGRVKSDLNKRSGFGYKDFIVLNYINKRYIECAYPLSDKKKYFIEVNLKNIHKGITNDELEKEIIIYKDTRSIYEKMDIKDQRFIKDAQKYIRSQLNNKGNQSDFSVLLLETENNKRYVYPFYHYTDHPVSTKDIDSHKFEIFFGLTLLNKDELFNNQYISVSSIINNEYTYNTGFILIDDGSFNFD